MSIEPLQLSTRPTDATPAESKHEKFPYIKARLNQINQDLAKVTQEIGKLELERGRASNPQELRQCKRNAMVKQKKKLDLNREEYLLNALRSDKSRLEDITPGNSLASIYELLLALSESCSEKDARKFVTDLSEEIRSFLNEDIFIHKIRFNKIALEEISPGLLYVMNRLGDRLPELRKNQNLEPLFKIMDGIPEKPLAQPKVKFSPMPEYRSSSFQIYDDWLQKLQEWCQPALKYIKSLQENPKKKDTAEFQDFQQHLLENLEQLQELITEVSEEIEEMGNELTKYEEEHQQLTRERLLDTHLREEELSDTDIDTEKAFNAKHRETLKKDIAVWKNKETQMRELQEKIQELSTKINGMVLAKQPSAADTLYVLSDQSVAPKSSASFGSANFFHTSSPRSPKAPVPTVVQSSSALQAIHESGAAYG